MLLLTRRPMVFLLGIGSYPVTAASVLRPCRDRFGRTCADLEANREKCPGRLPRTGRLRGGAGRAPGANGAPGGVSPARGRRGRTPAGMVAGRVVVSGDAPPIPDPPARAALPRGDGTRARQPSAGRTSSDHERAFVHHLVHRVRLPPHGGAGPRSGGGRPRHPGDRPARPDDHHGARPRGPHGPQRGAGGRRPGCRRRRSAAAEDAGDAACLRLLQAQGVAVVVELDDHLTALPPGHQGHELLIRRGVGRIAESCAREADFVTVSTPRLLQEYGPRGHGMVVPNAIPRRIAALPPAYEREPEVVTIGWTGTVGTHPYDLQEMGTGLGQALERTWGRSRFLVMGQGGDARAPLRLAAVSVRMGWA